MAPDNAARKVGKREGLRERKRGALSFVSFRKLSRGKERTKSCWGKERFFFGTGRPEEKEEEEENRNGGGKSSPVSNSRGVKTCFLNDLRHYRPLESASPSLENRKAPFLRDQMQLSCAPFAAPLANINFRQFSLSRGMTCEDLLRLASLRARHIDKWLWQRRPVTRPWQKKGKNERGSEREGEGNPRRRIG